MHHVLFNMDNLASIFLLSCWEEAEHDRRDFFVGLVISLFYILDIMLDAFYEI